MTVRTALPRLAALAAVAVFVSGCALDLPPGVTDQSREISALYRIIFVVAVAIFVLVEGLIVYSVLRYRRRPGDDELPPQIHGNPRAEVVWTLVPLLIVLIIFLLSWQTLNRVEAASETTNMTIEVKAFQFQWEFKYPAEGVTVIGTFEKPPEMVVPVDERILIRLRSADVIHAFYVSAFNFKRDAVPGVENTFQFTVREPGTYRGQCAELCGVYHSRTLLTVRAVSRAEFDAWVRSSLATLVPSPPPSASPEGSGPVGRPGGELGSGRYAPDRAPNIAFDQPEDACRSVAGAPYYTLCSTT